MLSYTSLFPFRPVNFSYPFIDNQCFKSFFGVGDYGFPQLFRVVVLLIFGVAFVCKGSTETGGSHQIPKPTRK